MAPLRTTARRRLAPVAVCTLVALVQCGPRLDLPDVTDAGPDVSRCLASTPVVRPLPDRMPYTVATVRGSAPGAVRVEVRGGMNPVFRPALPDGAFCIDVPVPQMGTYDFEIWSYDADGNASCMPGHATTSIDRSAPRIAGLTTCNDVDPVMCDAAGNCGTACRPNCGTRHCGDDGCGGSCGPCLVGMVCNASGACVAAPPMDAGRDGATDAAGGMDVTDPCRLLTRCGTCTPMAGCGWCRTMSSCTAGTSSGATGGVSCSGTNWIWLPSGCPDGG